MKQKIKDEHKEIKKEKTKEKEEKRQANAQIYISSVENTNTFEESKGRNR